MLHNKLFQLEKKDLKGKGMCVFGDVEVKCNLDRNKVHRGINHPIRIIEPGNLPGKIYQLNFCFKITINNLASLQGHGPSSLWELPFSFLTSEENC